MNKQDTVKSFRFCGFELQSRVFLAPMAGVTNRAFREITRSFGCSLAYTEMISSEGLVRGDRKSLAYLPERDEGGRIAVQLFGRRPEALRDAALIAAAGRADLIDINFGCPVRKIVKGGSGAALMKDPEIAKRILDEVCRAVKKPVTIKIRAGWGEESKNALVIAQIAEDCGAAAVTVHGRTALQGYRGRADWGIIEEVAGKLTIPVIGNGDLKTTEQIRRRLEETKCTAVMIGRGALGNPWIFRPAGEGGEKGEESRPSSREVGDVMLKHLELSLQEFGERRGLLQMRQDLAWYSRGLPAAVVFRRRINCMDSVEAVRREIVRLTAPSEEAAQPLPVRV